MEVRALTQPEQKYTYSQSTQIAGQTGCIGHLRGDFDSSGNGFFITWDDHWDRWKTDEFKAELDEVMLDCLSQTDEEKLQEMEPMVIEELTEIYDHVFKAGLKDQKEIIFHLLDTTLHRIDSGREFIVRVSQTDYEYINTRKDALLTGMPGVRMDLVADVTMKRGEGIIETGGGLFDCSIDVELQELKNRIHMLAYQKE